MHNIEYDIVQYSIKIINIKLKKLDLLEEELIDFKPSIIFKNKYITWERKLDEIKKEKCILYNELMIEYQKAEKILSPK